MPPFIPAHVQGLLAYLSHPEERANEDLALNYFRVVFGDGFTRQHDAKRSDGYVPGHFVLELKGATKNWFSGFFQALAYRNLELDFGQVVVAAKNFLAVWRVDQLPTYVLESVRNCKGAPHTAGRLLGVRYAAKKDEILKIAIWNGGLELSGQLFLSNPGVLVETVKSFERTLREGRKVRQRITPRNFTAILGQMTEFFNQPMKAVRAFYSMCYGWDETSTLLLSQKSTDQATLGGEIITNLLPAMRYKFKEFVERHAVVLNPTENTDDFFARYDAALDAADQEFRVKNGIFFTDLDLSKFVMWFVKQYVPQLGKNYLVIDPACGSGNLVTNWRSPLELRHKVVSEIEPELLFAVEQRMKGDHWHNGRFTVVPKINENRGLNFLDRSAQDYLNEIRRYLIEKGHKPDKPLAFLCNPPYRNDEDQAVGKVAYKPHDSIISITGMDASNERYCCFLAQMKLICDEAKSTGLPGDSLLLLFTKSSWLTTRGIFKSIRSHMLGVFEDVDGILIDGSEFFDVKGIWPVAFTVWRYKGNDANLNPHRSVPLTDLTWLRKEQLANIKWNDPKQLEQDCHAILSDERVRRVELGRNSISIRDWSGQKMVDFKRSRRISERDHNLVGGLPLGDRRQTGIKAYGEQNGPFIGFMDDLTPCRIRRSIPDKPWFRLNNQFMDFKKNRCFSGPPTNRGYCASDLKTAQRLFFWYSLARTFFRKPYPMWADAEDMWDPSIPSNLECKVFQIALAVGYAENECVETRFPANNPVNGAPELVVRNPMTPLDPQSFWSTEIRPYVYENPPKAVRNLVTAVNELFNGWQELFRKRRSLQISPKPYLLDNAALGIGSGIVQIKDYAAEADDKNLLDKIARIQELLKTAKDYFWELITAKDALNYFGARRDRQEALPEKTKFERTLARRLATSAILIDALNGDIHFGRTKLAKLFYLADVHEDLNLATNYYREAAGPLDPRALYNANIGIESLGRKYKLFFPEKHGAMFRYQVDTKFKQFIRSANHYLGNNTVGIKRIAELFRNLKTEQAEIIATLYACWNDFLIRKRTPTDSDIIDEFLRHWHSKKERFSKVRLFKALAWMRAHKLIPKGLGKLTSIKPPTDGT